MGGSAATLVDATDTIADRLTWALGVIALSTFVLLFLFTGSLLIPVKAIVTNLLSLSATFGALVYVFQEGHLRWLVGDFTPTGTLETTLPVHHRSGGARLAAHRRTDHRRGRHSGHGLLGPRRLESHRLEGDRRRVDAGRGPRRHHRPRPVGARHHAAGRRGQLVGPRAATTMHNRLRLTD
nr:MMPL family transporter [Nocardioides aequoreus]